MRRLATVLCAMGVAGTATQAIASGFQLFEQDAASLGNFHAGYAAAAEDASTAFYNPAGITRFDHQQMVMSAIGAMPNVKYRGTVEVDSLGGGPRPINVQAGAFGFIPALHYVAPISETLGFGFSIDAPFGAKTNYGDSSVMRYVATQTSMSVVDISPSFGVKVTKKGSLGAGFDIQKMEAEFDQVGTLGGRQFEADGINSVNDVAYGYHLGALYEFSDNTRAGVSYHSKVTHHLTGTSYFSGSLMTLFPGADLNSRSKVRMTLPSYTAFSTFHQLNKQWALMGSAIYTQWNTIKNIEMQNAAGIQGLEPSTNITVTIPQYFQNSWNVSVGSNYYASEDVILRTGIGYDQTPVRDNYRNPQLPDNDRYVVALGGHYQATKALGLDVSWAHLFMNKAHIIPPPQVTGDQTSIVNGSARVGADVLGAQLTWNIT